MERLDAAHSAVRRYYGDGAVAALRVDDDTVAALVRVLLAAVERDCECLLRLANGADGGLLRAEPELHYALAWNVYRTCGPTEAVRHLPDENELRTLRARWRENVQHIRAIGRLLGGGRSALQVTGASAVDFLPNAVLPIVAASLNGSGPAPFIVDTAAPTSVISDAWSKRLALKVNRRRPRRTSDGSGGVVTLVPGLVDRLELGTATCTNLPIEVIDLPRGLSVAGIISPLESLRGVEVELDQPARTLRLRPGRPTERTSQAPGQGAFTTKVVWSDGRPLAFARVDRQPCLALLDTGAGGDLLCRDFAVERLGYRGRRVGTTLTAAGKANVFSTMTADLAVDGGPVERLEFHVRDCIDTPDSLTPLRADVTLGAGWLADRRITFAADGRSVTFSSRKP